MGVYMKAYLILNAVSYLGNTTLREASLKLNPSSLLGNKKNIP
jgi:hypothetical protein